MESARELDSAHKNAACLRPTRCIDCDHPEVQDFAHRVVFGFEDERERRVRLFLAVRDEVRYDPYSAALDPDELSASSSLARGRAFCVPKAVLLCAAARALGIPARLGFVDVRNHLASPRLLELLRTDLFVFHGYTELWIDGSWVKATPAFDQLLCQHFGVAPLDFDGIHDAVFQPFDQRGRKYMEYVRSHGSFDDLPVDLMAQAWREAYPHLIVGTGAGITGDLQAELLEGQGD